MVLPDRPGSESNRPKSGRAVPFVVAALGIVVGFTLMGVLSPAEPVAVESTTTTSTTVAELEPPIDPDNFGVDQIARGEPLDWGQVAESDSSYAIALTEHDGDLFLFVSSTPTWDTDPGGLFAWKSEDGEIWDLIGRVISENHKITGVVSTGGRILATGIDPNVPGFVLWESDDGVDWRRSEVAVEPESPYMSIQPMTVATTSDVMVVATTWSFDPGRLLQERLSAAGYDVELSTVEWAIQPTQDGVGLTVFGPLGTAALAVTLEELGLTEDETRWVTSGYSPVPEVDLWTRLGNDWQQQTLNMTGLDSMVAAPDGSFLAVGAGGAGLPVAYRSEDGVEWRTIDEDLIPMLVRNWERLLAGHTSASPSEIVLSDDGRTWQRSGIADLFPHSRGWYATAFGTGPDGVAMVMEGRRSGRSILRADAPTLTSNNGVTITLDFEENALILTDSDGATHEWDMPRRAPAFPEGIDVDLGRRVVVFSDSQTGEDLEAFTFRDLRWAELQYYATGYESIQHQAFIFSRDGSDWTVQAIDDELDGNRRVVLLSVGAGHVAAVTVDVGEWTSPSPSPGFEIWSAKIP